MATSAQARAERGPNPPTSMRAAVLYGPGDIRVVDRPVPSPGPGEVLVKVAMCGTCGSDLRTMAGKRADQPNYGNFVPGHEWTGTVAALGPTVDELAVGDRVAIHAHRGCMRCANCIVGGYTACLNYGRLDKGHRATGITADGGFAEYVVHHVSALYRLPDNLAWEDAVLAMTAGTGLYGLEVAGSYVAGQSVAVIGPGPIGLMTAQACKALGAEPVILTGTRENRLALGRKLGIDHTVNVRQEDAVAAVRRLTDGRGVDLVVETSGALEGPSQCLQMVKRGGRVLLLAFYDQPVTVDLSAAVREDITLFATRGEGAAAVGRAVSLLAQGRIRGADLVTHHLPLEQIQEGFEMLRDRTDDPIKLVFVP
jgi:L-iditol 2-dehydrogenase